MGNSSSNLYLSLVIHPPDDPEHRGYYVAGTSVRGVVYVNSTNDNVQPGSKMDLYFTGKEHSCVEYQETQSYREDGETKYRSVTRYAYAKRDIVRISVPVIEGVTNAYVGKYEYPFEITLPYHLPTSMDFTRWSEYCRIVYKVKVELSGSSWFNNFNQEYEIPVTMAPLPISPVPYNVEPMEEKITLCCCINQGNIIFGASVDDTRLAPGERVNISFACMNESTAEIQTVYAKISQKIEWSARGHGSQNTDLLVNQNFQQTDRMDALRKSELKSRQDPNYIAEARDLMAEKTMREVYEAIKTSDNMVSLFIPHNAKHTYYGQCCTVKHYLTIKIKTGFGKTDPTIRIPVQIGTASDKSELDIPVPSAPPSHWNTTEPEQDVQVPVIPSFPAPSAPPPDWEADVVVPSTIISSNQVQIGAVVEGEEEDNDAGPFVPVVPTPVIVPTSGPSLQGLIDELNVSVSASSIVRQRIEDDLWKRQVFATLNPQQFVRLITSLSIEFDQAEVAAIIAPEINQFTCQFIVAIIKAVSNWLRVTMIQRLLPYTVDLAANSEQILQTLTAWEKISTEKDFEVNLNRD